MADEREKTQQVRGDKSMSSRQQMQADVARRPWPGKRYAVLVVVGMLAGLGGLANLGWELVWMLTHGAPLPFLALAACGALVAFGSLVFLVWFLTWGQFWRPRP